MSSRRDRPEQFYRDHSQRYAQVAHSFGQSVYSEASHPWLKNDWDLLHRAEQLSRGTRCLDAGCGAGARDVYKLWLDGYDAVGIDAVEENVALARQLHPEIADRVSVADLRQPLPYPSAEFGLVLCNAVIQHIPQDEAFAVTIPELIRVLRPGGILQLMFKNGQGTLTLYDKDYGLERSFLLYDERCVLDLVRRLGMEPVATDDCPGEVVYFTDPKGAPHCAFHARMSGQ